jgi:hypothetical protein
MPRCLRSHTLPIQILRQFFWRHFQLLNIYFRTNITLNYRSMNQEAKCTDKATDVSIQTSWRNGLQRLIGWRVVQCSHISCRNNSPSLITSRYSHRLSTDKSFRNTNSYYSTQFRNSHNRETSISNWTSPRQRLISVLGNSDFCFNWSNVWNSDLRCPLTLICESQEIIPWSVIWITQEIGNRALRTMSGPQRNQVLKWCMIFYSEKLCGL